MMTQPDTDGWRVLDYTFERIEEARAFVLGMGTDVTVIAPEELRLSIFNLAKDVVAHYTRERDGEISDTDYA